MLGASELSEAKRALIEECLQGKPLPTTKKVPGSTIQPASISVDSSGEGVVPIQTTGSARPFFFLHGDWTENAYFCFPLARDLGAEQPFYNLEPYNFDGLPTLPSLEAMAAAHIKAMRVIQPEGPYLLGGFCNGGLTAYEMARQLYAVGEKVDLLVLMDVIPARLITICRVIRSIGKLLRWGADKQLDWFLRLEHAARYLLDRDSEDFAHIKKTDPRICRFFPPIETLRKEYPAMFTWATSDYQPGFYPGKVTLFWDEAEPERRGWWDKWARGKDREVEVHIIAGTHTTCKTSHLYSMAQHLRECLNKVQVARST
jgi:thioesterase domain-containing protein